MALETSGTHENMDAYERQKVEATIEDIELLGGTARNFLKMIDFCNEKGIKLYRSVALDQIRFPNAPAGPGNDMTKLRGLFQQGQIDLAKSIPVEYKQELEQRMEKRSP